MYCDFNTENEDNNFFLYYRYFSSLYMCSIRTIGEPVSSISNHENGVLPVKQRIEKLMTSIDGKNK